MTRGLGRLKKAAKRKNPGTNRHRRDVISLVHSIINEADILLEVLDARFVEKSRNHIAESRIRKQGKPLIYVLNKSDLVDTGKVQQETELESLRPYVFFSSRDRKGALALRKLIKIASSRIDPKEPGKILVGVIGYPNAGKSSLINYLTGKASTRVSSEAGHTKGIQKLKLSEGIYLLDTPGVIPAQEKLSLSHADTASKLPKIGAVSWNKTKDPEMTLMHLMRENSADIERYYAIDAKGNTEVLVEELGRRWHVMKKGGLVDEERTARKVLRDWQEGRIKIF